MRVATGRSSPRVVTATAAAAAVAAIDSAADLGPEAGGEGLAHDPRVRAVGGAAVPSVRSRTQ